MLKMVQKVREGSERSTAAEIERQQENEQMTKARKLGFQRSYSSSCELIKGGVYVSLTVNGDQLVKA